MKKLNYILLGLLCSFLFGCLTPQITRDGVSFEGLKTFYVEAPQNGDAIFDNSGILNERSKELVNFIATNLESKGYVRVANKAEAQIVFVPVWSASVKDPIGNDPLPLQLIGSNFSSTNLLVGSSMNNVYATLEIQAFVKGDNRWGWRGFSPLETNANNITTAMLRDQATWALEFFPPEKYPNPRKPFLELFESSNVTKAEIEKKNQELAEAEKQKQIQEQDAKQKAKARATKKLVEKTGDKNAVPTEAQIQAEIKPETIEDIEKLFNKNMKKYYKKD